MVPAIIAGASALGGGIFSSILGKKSNDRTNETNLKIAQMNNEWSEKMMDKQNIYNIDQWNREAAFAEKQAADANAFTEYMQDKANKYNSAQEQAKRLREAGLNPSIVMNGGNAGTAQGASGAQAATPSGNSVGLPSPSSAQMRPYDYSGISRAITDAAMVSLQFQKQQAEVTNMNLNNEYLYKSMQNRLNQDYEKYRAQKYDTDYRKMNESTRVAIENENYLMAVTNRLMAQEQITLIKQQVAYQRLINKNLPQELSMNIAVLASQRDLNRKNIERIAEEIVYQSLQNQQIKYSPSELKRIKEATIDAIESESWLPLTSIFGSSISAAGSMGRKPARIYSPQTRYTNIYN